MPSRFRSALLVSALAAVGAISATSAAAQDTKNAKDAKDAKTPAAPECNPAPSATPALAKATFSMQRAFSAMQGKRDGSRDLKDAINSLTTVDQKNPPDSIGRAYYLGQAYILLLQQPGVKPVGHRGDFGIATDTSLTVDLLAAADTAFGKVEQAVPSCRSEMAKWRQQQPWLDALNGSIAALNAEHYDSAEALAKRSLVIDRSAPYAYAVIASAANHRKDYDTAIEMNKKAIDIASKDTLYADQKASAMYDLAGAYSARAEAATGAEQKARVQEAIAAWQAFIPVGTHDLQVASAVQNMRKLLRLVNDTLSNQAYVTLLANPSHYGESALLNGGLIATQSKKPDDAIKLFSAVLDQNPYERDALNNLAATYASAKQPDKMLPLIDRLVSLDPNSEDAWLLYAYAYSGLLKGTSDPKLTKAYTDSLLKFNAKAEALTPRLALAAFTHSAKESTVSGTIENYIGKPAVSVSGKPLKSASKTTGTTKTYTLTMEFLDAKGNVLGTQTASVGPVAPGSTEQFSVTLPSQDAVAFRYKPIS